MDNASMLCALWNSRKCWAVAPFRRGPRKEIFPEGNRRATISVEMARPRLAASVLVEVSLFAYFKGMFARVARKLKVSPSMVSKVASGHRYSPEIQSALLEELRVVKQKLESIS
jgi:hypothetical protein